MIHLQTILKIGDNTGIKKGQCIKIFKQSKGTIGSIILISIKNLKLNTKKKTKFAKGDIVRALIIRTKYATKNTIGNYIKFDENSIIILNNQDKPLGTKIFGSITSEFRKRKNFKILSLASNIL
jgi:large subunit ribosomal protein L14